MPNIDRGDCQLYWADSGRGEPLLLVQGLGYPSDMWYRWLPDLTQRYRVLRFDNRGVGRTGVPPGPYTIEQMADDALAVLDTAGVERAHIVGASLGGIIVQQLALDHPDRLLSLVLACTGPGGGEHVQPDPEATAMAVARASLTPEEAAEVAVPFVYAKATSREMIEEDFATRARIPTTPEGYSNQLSAVLGYAGSASRLSEITVPTLVMTGTEDRLVHPDNSTFLAEHIRGARLVRIEGASHVMFTDQPVATLQTLLDFLADVPMPRVPPP
jgi:3-oxoadipate enol-lactonase